MTVKDFGQNIDLNNDLECMRDETFCGECANCREWERTADLETYEEEKRKRIFDEQENDND